METLHESTEIKYPLSLCRIVMEGAKVNEYRSNETFVFTYSNILCSECCPSVSRLTSFGGCFRCAESGAQPRPTERSGLQWAIQGVCWHIKFSEACSEFEHLLDQSLKIKYTAQLSNMAKP